MCVQGHRAKECVHFERIAEGSVYVIKKRGRPSKACANDFHLERVQVIGATVDPQKNAVCLRTGKYRFQCDRKCCFYDAIYLSDDIQFQVIRDGSVVNTSDIIKYLPPSFNKIDLHHEYEVKGVSRTITPQKKGPPRPRRKNINTTVSNKLAVSSKARKPMSRKRSRYEESDEEDDFSVSEESEEEEETQELESEDEEDKDAPFRKISPDDDAGIKFQKAHEFFAYYQSSLPSGSFKLTIETLDKYYTDPIYGETFRQVDTDQTKNENPLDISGTSQRINRKVYAFYQMINGVVPLPVDIEERNKIARAAAAKKTRELAAARAYHFAGKRPPMGYDYPPLNSKTARKVAEVVVDEAAEDDETEAVPEVEQAQVKRVKREAKRESKQEEMELGLIHDPLIPQSELQQNQANGFTLSALPTFSFADDIMKDSDELFGIFNDLNSDNFENSVRDVFDREPTAVAPRALTVRPELEMGAPTPTPTPLSTPTSAPAQLSILSSKEPTDDTANPFSPSELEEFLASFGPLVVDQNDPQQSLTENLCY